MSIEKKQLNILMEVISFAETKGFEILALKAPDFFGEYENSLNKKTILGVDLFSKKIGYEHLTKKTYE